MSLYKIFEEYNIIEKRHCILRSGKHSNIYVNKIKITTMPTLYYMIISWLVNLISKTFKETEYDIITGPAVAGISFAAPISLNLKKPFIFPEKQITYTETDILHKMKFRNHFRRMLRGKKKVIIIEDVITTGGSVAKTGKAILEEGGIPVAVFCILNRNPKLNSIECEDFKIFKFPIYSLESKKINDWPASKCIICNK